VTDDGEGAACALQAAHDATFSEGSSCENYMLWDTAIAFVPFWLRLLQCLHRYHAEGGPTQLWNALKYLSCICVIGLSLADHVLGPADAGPWDFGRRPWKAGWLAMVVVSTAFKLYWDLRHDWGFGLGTLRPRLMYPRPFYYFAVAANAGLRCSWALTISPAFFHLGSVSDLWLSSCTAAGEVCRRFLWTLVRIENAHASAGQPGAHDRANHDHAGALTASVSKPRATLRGTAPTLLGRPQSQAQLRTAGLAAMAASRNRTAAATVGGAGSTAYSLAGSRSPPPAMRQAMMEESSEV
jgi:hypothetical protein